MKPYYQGDGVTIYHGDCFEVLPELPKVDLVLTDPPYGISLKENGRNGHNWDISGDKTTVAGRHFLAWCERGNVPTVAFAHPRKPWPSDWRCLLVWDKGPTVGGGGDPSTCWKQTWELIQVARTGKLNGKRDEAVLRYHITQQNYHLHPCQKPIALLSYLIGKTTNVGDLILDSFAGSGSTLLAAKREGRKSIGIEIEEEYCEIAANRLAQGVLF